MAQKLKEKGSIRHVMDFRHPHVVVVVLAAVLCAAVLALLWLDPGQRGNQLEGVEMSVVRAMDQGVPVDLPEDMARELVRLIRVYDKGDYNDLSGYRPASGDICLSDQHGGTVFYLTRTLDREPVLVRINHDGYGWTSAFEGLTLTGMEDDLDYAKWRDRAETYLTKGRAEDLYRLKTPYIGSQVAAGEILKALNVEYLAGPYTIELQTEKEPYGITLHLQNIQVSQRETQFMDQYLRQVGVLFTALVDNAACFNWDYETRSGVTGSGIQPGLRKPVDQGAFQILYEDYRQALSGLADPAAEMGLYSLGEALYLSPEMSWGDTPGYIGSVTIARDLFSVQMSHALSSAWPQMEDCPNPSYQWGETPNAIQTRDGGAIDLTGFSSRNMIVVHNAQGEDVGYRLYQLDGELWLSWMDFSEQRNDIAEQAVWVFRLSAQPETHLPADEAE